MAKSAIEVKQPYVKTVCEFDEGGKFGEIRFESKHGVIVWDIDSFSEENKRHAMVQAFRSKGADDYAGHAQDWDFVTGVLSVMEERMRSSEWNVGRAESFGGTTDLFQAIVNINSTPITFEAVTQVWEAYSDTDKKALRGRADVQAEILQIKLNRANAKAQDTDELSI